MPCLGSRWAIELAMKTNLLLILASLFLAVLCGCKTYNDPIFYHSVEPKVISEEAGQVYVMKVQGRGASREDAVNNALLQAVKDVIFKDIHVAYGDHKSLLRLINNPSEEANHSDFFSQFFSPTGAYLKFITPIDKNREFHSNGSSHTVLMDVRVNREALKSYLHEMNIM